MLRTIRKAIYFLDAEQRRAWLALVPLGVATAAMEAIGAATVFALIRLIDRPTEPEAIPLVAALQGVLLGWDVSPIVSFAALVGCFYLAKNALRLVEVYVRERCAAASEASIATRLLGRYLAAPYVYHLRRNSAELIRNTTQSALTVSQVVLLSATAALSEALVVAGILAVVIHSAPTVALMAGAVVAATMVAMLRFTQSAHTRWGRRTNRLNAAIMQSLQQSLGGVKEVKVLGREKFFTSAFARRRMELSAIQVRRGVLAVAPRLLVETLFVCGVVAVIIGVHGSTQSELVPLLGLLAYAGLRRSRAVPGVGESEFTAGDVIGLRVRRCRDGFGQDLRESRRRAPGGLGAGCFGGRGAALVALPGGRSGLRVPDERPVDERFELVVPYPTRGSNPTLEITARGPYSLRVVSAPDTDGAEIGRVDVSPNQIRTGARIELGFMWQTPPPSRMP